VYRRRPAPFKERKKEYNGYRGAAEMRELIENILAAEGEAAQIVSSARNEAAAVSRAADEVIRKEKQQIKEESRELLLAKTEEARKAVSQMKVPELPAERGVLLSELNISPRQFDTAAAAVTDLLIRPRLPDRES
jgi:hypothetical protein